MIMLSENKIESVTMKYFCKYKFLKCKPDCYYFCWASIPMKVSRETELSFNRHESKFIRPIIIINASVNFGVAVFILLSIIIFYQELLNILCNSSNIRRCICLQLCISMLNLSIFSLALVTNILINAKVKACYLFLNSFHISH